MKTIKKIFFLVGFSVFVLQSQATQESSFCQSIEEAYLSEFARDKVKFNTVFGEIQNAETPNEHYNSGMQAFFAGDVDKSIEEFEKITQVERGDPLLRAVSLNHLMFLYLEKGDLEQSFSYLHERTASSLVGASHLFYQMALFYSKLCEEDLKEARTKIMLEQLSGFYKVKETFPDMIDYGTHMKYYMDINNYPKDYIRAYYWTDLAMKNKLPLADELNYLIAEKMTAEEIEQALNLSY